jgi:hypothetical protein
LATKGNPLSPVGLLLAPLAAVPAAAIHLSLWHWNTEAASGALYAALVILPLSYSLTFLVGLPCLFALHRFGLLNTTSMCAGGLILGLLVGFLIGVTLFPLWDWYARSFYLSMGALCGVSVGLALAPFTLRRGR